MISDVRFMCHYKAFEHQRPTTKRMSQVEALANPKFKNKLRTLALAMPAEGKSGQNHQKSNPASPAAAGEVRAGPNAHAPASKMVLGRARPGVHADGDIFSGAARTLPSWVFVAGWIEPRDHRQATVPGEDDKTDKGRRLKSGQ